MKDNEYQKSKIEKRLDELSVLYEMLERMVEKGCIVNVWGGCEDNFSDPDGSVLSDFMEYIGLYYESLNVTDCIEAVYQILCWQYQSMHEGVITYYENFYGGSEYQTIVETAKFLKKNDYFTIYQQYNKGIVLCKEHEYTKEEINVKELDAWINWHTKEVWDFCATILLKYKNEWSWK